MTEPSEEQDELIQEFLLESAENLDDLDLSLVALEEDPQNGELLDRVFRTIHTLKGTAGFLALPHLESLAHVAENLLSQLREGHLLLDADRTTALLAAVDAIRDMLTEVGRTGTDGDEEHAALKGQLTALTASDAATVLDASDCDAPSSPKEPTLDTSEGSGTQEDGAGEKEAAPNASGSEVAAEAAVRVDVGLLDELMNLVGELVLSRNQLLQHAVASDTTFSGTAQRLNLITTELQEGVMKTRMQPIGKLWSKFPRVVRDLAQSCRKKVSIEMIGQDTELDRTILESMKDPLTHMLRNCVDHGVESPEDRVAAGKEPEGKLLLRASHEGGQVIVELCDDGRGIDTAAVLAKALERDVVSRDQAARLVDREILQLLFAPGFSTAEKVTNVSGRGVGLDVVKTNVEKIGGTIDVQTTPGEGTSLKIKIPLTLAIIPALTVTAASERFAIPQVGLVELVRLEGERARAGVERINGVPVYRLRGNLLPLLFLDRQLGIASEPEPSGEVEATDDVNIVVLQAEGRQFGVIVDEVNETEEIVVKPLGPQLSDIPAFAGATIMGDGRVALILDVLGLGQQARALAERPEAVVGHAGSERGGAEGERRSLLLCDAGAGRRMAVPLSYVARLEELDSSRLERAGSLWVTQYRNEIMPVIPVGGSVAASFENPSDLPEKLIVVVCRHRDRNIGLVVERISDVVDEVCSLDEVTRAEDILGSVVVQGQVTDLLDVDTVISDAVPILRGGGDSTAEARS